MKIKISTLGSDASWSDKNHFSMLITINEKKIWIDPAIKLDEKVDYIIVSEVDFDHWRYLESYLKKYSVPVYSTRSVLSHINLKDKKLYKNFHPIKSPIKVDGVQILLFSIPLMVGLPAIGIRLKYKNFKVSIIPEFDKLGKREQNLIKNSIWIVGVGEFEKRKPNDHKATFMELISLADELKPSRIYLTNFRKSLLKHRKEILRYLKKYNGGLMVKGSSISYHDNKIQEDVEKTDGLYIIHPYSALIYDGIKTIIVKDRKFNISNRKFLLVDNNFAYGYIILDNPIQINNKKEFLQYFDGHLVSLNHFKEWDWSYPVYAYKIREFKKFDELKYIRIPHGIQTIVKDVEKYIEKLHLDEFKQTGVDSDIKNVKKRWRECIADLRYLGNSAYPRLKAGKKWGTWKLNDVYKYFAALVDALRSVFFHIIPPFKPYDKLYEKIHNRKASDARKSSFWQCYKQSEKYMKSQPPKDINEIKDWDTKRQEIISKSKIKPGYYSYAKPVYRGYFEELEENLKAIKWNDKKLLVDTKWDGLRMTIGKTNGKGWAYVDPENLKEKSSNISNRIPVIISEIEKYFPDNTVLDGEFLAIHPNKKEMLHRTAANSILNSNMSGKELEDYAIIFIFDVLFFEGNDIRKQPLHERLEYLSRLKSTDHIWIEKISTKFPSKADGFIIDGKNVKVIPKIGEFIEEAKNGRPKYCGEGVMIKRLDGPYEYPQNHYWMKVKFWHELDLRVIDRKKVKGSKNTFNYYLGYDTPRDYAKSYLEHTTKDWYGKVFVFKNGKIIASGKDSKQYLDDKNVRFVTFMGKSDNTNIKANINDILRIAAEEVLRFENTINPDFPRYSFYIGRALEVIPEKNITDSLDTIDKLSQFEPKRISIDELRHIKEEVKKSSLREEILEWVEKGKIPDDKYKEIAKELEPLPDIYYTNHQDGYLAWAQWHIRGLNPDDVKKWKDGKITTKELVQGHSLHMDLRMQWGKDKNLQQWVITDSDMKSYLRSMRGETDPKTGNIQKSLVIVKPSAVEPGKVVKTSQDELLLDNEGARIVEEYELKDKSFIIPAGGVGSTPYKDAYLIAIWIGKVKFGVQREDAHEIFLYPSKNIPEKNQKLLDGKYIIRCFKTGNDKRWWFFKSPENKYPMDPIYHSDTSHYWPIPAEKIKKFGRDAYREESKKMYVRKFTKKGAF